MSDRSCKMCRKWMALAVEYGDLCYGCCQSELTTLRAQLAAKERECEELRRQLAIDPMFDETDALLGGEKGEGR